MKPKRAFWIKADEQKILPYEYTGLESMQKAVDGLIVRAFEFPNGDTLFVNDEGMWGTNQAAILVEGAHQPFYGNGIVVGPPSKNGRTMEATSTLEELQKLIKFSDFGTLRAKYVQTLGR